MHPIVNLRAASAGALETPAAERRGLMAKVAIGSKWQPPLRERLEPHAGVYRGFNPFADSDARLVQAAVLGRGLGTIEPQRRRRDRRIVDALWWVLGGALMATLVWLVLFVGPALGF